MSLNWKGRELSDASVRAEVLALLEHHYSPDNPLIVPQSVYAEAMKDPDLLRYADRIHPNLPLPTPRKPLFQASVAWAI